MSRASPSRSVTADAAAALGLGKDALRRGAWEDARAAFGASLMAGETAEAHEQVGLAAWWLDDATLTLEARQRAYTLYREAGDARGAARVALWLVWDYLAFRGDTAVASGWLERARRILAGHESMPEYGFLLLREGEVALFRGHDPATARERAARAADLGRSNGDLSLEFTALALEGLALVSAGSVADGMRRLDEASTAATAGELKELHSVSVVCCWQIFACERVRDYDRAAQWCARVQEFARRWRVSPLSAICRTQYAGVLVWRGAWGEAEAELAAATRELEAARPATVTQALARLGDLRLKQGRLEEAAQLFARSGAQPLARQGQAALALERGDAAESVTLIEQFLAKIADGEQTVRAGALELAVRAYAARGDAARTARAVSELDRVAERLGTVPLIAAAAAARGVLSRLRGSHARAATEFDEAVSRYEESGAPFEAARARLELAATLFTLARREAAEREARAAAEALEELGAARDAVRAGDLRRQIAGKPENPETLSLTARQLEILRLVAQGMSNPEIAARLKLSDHTVKRHVANLLTRLGLSSRAAAAAYATREGLI